MKRLIFPFGEKWSHLKNIWWHRTLVVLFFLSEITCLLWIWFSQNASELQGYSSCFQLYLAMAKDSIAEQSCSAFLPHSGENFLGALFISVLLWYLLQILYYKVFLYIVFGNQNNKLHS